MPEVTWVPIDSGGRPEIPEDELSVDVLAVTELGGKVYPLKYSQRGFWDSTIREYWKDDAVTHWAYLPEPPGEDNR